MAEDVHTERLLVTVFIFLHMSFFPLVNIVRTLCIHHENNSDVPEYYVEAPTNQRYWACLSVVGMVYSLYSLRTPKIPSLGGVIGCYIQLTHTSSIHY